MGSCCPLGFWDLPPDSFWTYSACKIGRKALVYLQFLRHCSFCTTVEKLPFSRKENIPSLHRVQPVLGNDLFIEAKEWSWNVIHWKLDSGEEEGWPVGNVQGHNISSGVFLSRYFSYSVNPDRIMIQEYTRQLPLACDWKRKHGKKAKKKKKKKGKRERKNR